MGYTARIAFDFKPTARHIDENGFLRVDSSHITKETVNPYYGREIPGWKDRGLDPEKIYYGYRSGEELKKAAKTFEGLPLLMGHHTESAEDPQREYRVGSLGTDAKWIAPYLDNSLFVTDEKAIRAIENGSAKEISCAYMYDPDFEPGEFEGVAYDFVMRNIHGNHVALVREGRAGQDVVVADEAIKLPDEETPETEEDMDNFEVEGQEEIIEEPAQDSAGSDAVKAFKTLLDVMIDRFSDEEKEELASLLAPVEDLSEDEDFEDPEAVKFGEKVERDKLIGERIREDEKAEKEEEDAEEKEMRPVIDEKIRAAADRCGMDAESEEFQRAFAEGVRYGEEKEKSEPKHLDSLHESEGMEKREKDVKAAMDAAIKASKSEMVKHFRELNDAGNAVRGLLGNIDVMAFDSAEDIYGEALKKCGVDTRNTPKSAWRYMFDVMRSQNSGNIIANDSKFESQPDYSGPFANLNNIRLG